MSAVPSRPVLRYHGGKWKLAPWILEHVPPHRCYVEPFGGAGSVWARFERLHMADGARPRKEVLWMNPACAAALDRGRSQTKLML